MLAATNRGFSALQRAENSSIPNPFHEDANPSASFSALQRAENSSIISCSVVCIQSYNVSVLFSEPKIPQSLGGAEAVFV